MDVYIYQADIYCEDCGKAICEDLKKSGEVPEDLDCYDSSEYPKGPYSDGGGEADSPQHCGCCEECINAIEIGGIKIGCWLENDLTEEGIRYVKDLVEEAIEQGQYEGSVVEFWFNEYSNFGYDLGD